MGIPNRELVMVSIVLGATYNIWEVGRLLNKGRRDLRNFVDRHRRNSSDWNGFEFVGWLEVDAFDPDGVHLLGSDKIMQLEEMLFDASCPIEPIWSPTIHGIMRVPSSLDHDHVRSALRHQWHLHRQTDVREFYSSKSAQQNISNIVNYANKNAFMYGPPGFKAIWDISWQVQFFDWMHQFSRGFQSIKVSINKKSID